MMGYQDLGSLMGLEYEAMAFVGNNEHDMQDRWVMVWGFFFSLNLSILCQFTCPFASFHTVFFYWYLSSFSSPFPAFLSHYQIPFMLFVSFLLYIISRLLFLSSSFFHVNFPFLSLWVGSWFRSLFFLSLQCLLFSQYGSFYFLNFPSIFFLRSVTL